LLLHIVYIIYTMSFIRKIRRNGKVYLAEVENRWINGKVVQKHLRYIGKEADGQTVLTGSPSNIEVDSVKVFGPLLVLHHIAEEIGLTELLGKYGPEILSMVLAHCVDYKSINQMETWYSRTDLSFLLGLENVTEGRLLEALDSLEAQDAHTLQQNIFSKVCEIHKLNVTGVVYDVTNTYMYGKKCPLGKLGHDKEGVKGRPLVQIGLAVTQETGIPICHKTFAGNINDAKTLQDFITDLGNYKISDGVVVYDRGIASADNIRDLKAFNWNTLCGLPIRGTLAEKVRQLVGKNNLINIHNRIRVNKTIFYVITKEHTIDGVKGTLAICYNEQQRRDLRESRLDEIVNAQMLLKNNKRIKEGLSKYFDTKGNIEEDALHKAEEFDGISCLFTTQAMVKEEMVRLYFNKDVVEKAFRTVKGITRLQPIRHWLYNRVVAHIFICYLSYLLLSLLQYRLRRLDITAEKALMELDTMYKVYLTDPKRKYKLSRIVTLSKKQEDILKMVNKHLINKVKT
jgi:transposase